MGSNLLGGDDQGSVARNNSATWSSSLVLPAAIFDSRFFTGTPCVSEWKLMVSCFRNCTSAWKRSSVHSLIFPGSRLRAHFACEVNLQRSCKVHCTRVLLQPLDRALHVSGGPAPVALLLAKHDLGDGGLQHLDALQITASSREDAIPHRIEFQPSHPKSLQINRPQQHSQSYRTTHITANSSKNVFNDFHVFEAIIGPQTS